MTDVLAALRWQVWAGQGLRRGQRPRKAQHGHRTRRGPSPAGPARGGGRAGTLGGRTVPAPLAGARPGAEGSPEARRTSRGERPRPSCPALPSIAAGEPPRNNNQQRPRSPRPPLQLPQRRRRAPGVPVQLREPPANIGTWSPTAGEPLCLRELQEARVSPRAELQLQAANQCAGTSQGPAPPSGPRHAVAVQWPSKLLWMEAVVFAASPRTCYSLASPPKPVTPRCVSPGASPTSLRASWA